MAKKKRKRKGTMPKGRITFKKVKGGFLINIKGNLFDEVTDKTAARFAIKRIQRLRKEDRIKSRKICKK